jgi:hypothetical protein
MGRRWAAPRMRRAARPPARRREAEPTDGSTTSISPIAGTGLANRSEPSPAIRSVSGRVASRACQGRPHHSSATGGNSYNRGFNPPARRTRRVVSPVGHPGRRRLVTLVGGNEPPGRRPFAARRRSATSYKVIGPARMTGTKRPAATNGDAGRRSPSHRAVAGSAEGLEVLRPLGADPLVGDVVDLGGPTSNAGKPPLSAAHRHGSALRLSARRGTLGRECPFSDESDVTVATASSSVP